MDIVQPEVQTVDNFHGLSNLSMIYCHNGQNEMAEQKTADHSMNETKLMKLLA